MIRETSEISDEKNTLKKAILNGELFEMVSFEGSPSKRDRGLTAVFDKFKIEHSLLSMSRSATNKKDFEFIVRKYFESYFLNNPIYSKEIYLKSLLVARANLEWCVVLHDEEGFTVVFSNRINEYGQNSIAFFKSATDFSNWLYKYYSDTRTNISEFQEKGLPSYDIEMRENSKPWPGNVDGVLFYKNNPVAIVEFQTTNKQSVTKHDNNDWWYPKRGRKGDRERWASINMNSQAFCLPILVGVWKPGESVFRIKSIQSIDFNKEVRRPITWGVFRDTNEQNVISDLEDLLNEMQAMYQ